MWKKPTTELQRLRNGQMAKRVQEMHDNRTKTTIKSKPIGATNKKEGTTTYAGVEDKHEDRPTKRSR